MNKCIKTLLIIALLGGAQAGHTAAFAKKVLVSKTGAVALASATMGCLYPYLPVNIPTAPSSLPVDAQQEILAHFKAEHGVEGVEICDAVPCSSNPHGNTGVTTHGGKIYFYISEYNRKIIMENKPSFPGYAINFDLFIQPTLTLEHLKRVWVHEACHVKEKHAETRAAIGGCVGGIALLAGKTARIAGRGRFFSLGVGALSYLAGVAQLQHMNRQQEKQCDLYAANTPENARLLREYYNQVGGREAFLEAGMPAPVKAIWRTFATHPPILDRMDYLEKRAQELEEEAAQNE